MITSLYVCTCSSNILIRMIYEIYQILVDPKSNVSVL